MPQLGITISFQNNQKQPVPGQTVTWKITDVNGAAEYGSGNGLTTTPQGQLILNFVSNEDPPYRFAWACAGEEGTFTIGPFQIVNQQFSRNVVLLLQSSTFTNPRRHWLTYETRYNWAPYCKVNAALGLKLYRANASDMLLVLAPACDLDDEALALLGGVFFPGVGPKDLRAFGIAPWYGSRKSLPVLDENQHPFAVLPYNARDNTNGSAAIGTNVKSRVRGLPLTALQQTIPMWNTASRSSIALLEAKSDPQKVLAEIGRGGELLWSTLGVLDPLRFLDPHSDGSELDLEKATLKNLFSIKTGVDLVGFEFQPKKAKLEHNSILAALRSAYIRQIESELYPAAVNDEKLLILTEIMTVTEADPNWDKWIKSKMGPDNPCGWEATAAPAAQPVFGDGFQVRSLRGMKTGKDWGYFPPTSIPFVSVTAGGALDADRTNSITYGVSEDKKDFFARGMPRSVGAFDQVSDAKWRDFWKKHYAIELGRTKARLLIRYGLQGFGGNAQNFLLEMQNGIPNGRIVVRDMGDYALHDFFLWAMFGPGKGDAPDPRGKGPGQQEEYVRQWRDAFKKAKSSVAPLLWFECKVLHEFYHEGDHSEFPTFTGYHRWPQSEMHTLNPFCVCCDRESAPFVGHISPLWAYALPVSPQKMNTYNCDLTAARWAQVFQTEAEWGIAHAKAWIGYLEAALGPGFTEEVVSRNDWTPVGAVKLKGNDPGGWRNSTAKRIHVPADYADAAYLGVDLQGPQGQLLIQNQGSEAIRSKWEDLYTQMKTWEMYLGMQVENYLRTERGQNGIRQYASGGWKAVEENPFPRERLRIAVILSGSRAPVANLQYTLLRNNVAVKRRLTKEGVDAIEFAELFGDDDRVVLSIALDNEKPIGLQPLNRFARSLPGTRYALSSHDVDVSYGPYSAKAAANF